VVFPMIVLQQLQRLTHLELAELELQGPDGEASLALQPLQPSAALQPLQASAGSLQPSLALQPMHALTRLVDLRLKLNNEAGDDRSLPGCCLAYSN
jgi:hypothetical protein